MERRIAVAAKFSSGGGGTQPVAARQTLRIDTLHGPSRQILHVFPPVFNSAGSKWSPHPIQAAARFTGSAQRKSRARTRACDLFRSGSLKPETKRKKSREFSVDVLVVSRGKIQYLVVVLRRAQLQVEPAFDLGRLIRR